MLRLVVDVIPLPPRVVGHPMVADNYYVVRVGIIDGCIQRFVDDPIRLFDDRRVRIDDM
jgi:hypothetical protein